MTYNGVTKWFNPKKGFGFITDPEGNDVYVHYTQIQKEGFKELVVGQKVTFEKGVDLQGRPSANNIEIVA